MTEHLSHTYEGEVEGVRFLRQHALQNIQAHANAGINLHGQHRRWVQSACIEACRPFIKSCRYSKRRAVQ